MNNLNFNYLLQRMRIVVVLLILSSPIQLSAQNSNTSIQGAWKINQDDLQHQLLLIDGFYIHTVHRGNIFQGTQGGAYRMAGNSFIAKTLFNSIDSNKVGQEIAVPFKIEGETLSVTLSNGTVTFQRVDNGTAPLAGVWRITGRMQEDGKIAAIHQTGSRQTYKMLTGSKFQWIAIDPAKKQFSGTGGGSYTFKDGKYTENIEFFSRDNSRVGAALIFDGQLKDGAWHHSGLSSKGAKIYEVWSKVK